MTYVFLGTQILLWTFSLPGWVDLFPFKNLGESTMVTSTNDLVVKCDFELGIFSEVINRTEKSSLISCLISRRVNYCFSRSIFLQSNIYIFFTTAFFLVAKCWGLLYWLSLFLSLLLTLLVILFSEYLLTYECFILMNDRCFPLYNGKGTSRDRQD